MTLRCKPGDLAIVVNNIFSKDGRKKYKDGHLRHIGVQDIAGIKDRCRVDEDSGCWNWAWGVSGRASYPVPMVDIGAGIIGCERITKMPAYRAAWQLSGHDIPSGRVVYRSCCNPLCCNPEHLKCGKRSAMYAHYAATNRNKGQPHRKVANARNRKKMMVQPERVREVEALIARGLLQKDIAERVGICVETVRRIRLGLHPNCSSGSAKQLVRGASVFSWGMA